MGTEHSGRLDEKLGSSYLPLARKWVAKEVASILFCMLVTLSYRRVETEVKTHMGAVAVSVDWFSHWTVIQ